MESVNTNTTMKQEAIKPVGILERQKQRNTGPLEPNVVIQPLRKETQPLDPNIQIPNLAKKPQPEPLEVFAEGQSKADQLAAARKVADTLQQQKIQKIHFKWSGNLMKKTNRMLRQYEHSEYSGEMLFD